MTPLEHRLRQRIDTLLDDREKLQARVRRLEQTSNNRLGQIRRRDKRITQLEVVAAENRRLRVQIHIAVRQQDALAAHLTATRIELDRALRLRRKQAA